MRFDGTIPQKARDSALHEFSCDKQFLVANKNCAGYSLNLQFCSNIIYMSNDWDLGTRLQSEDRVHRIGQRKDVKIIDIYAENTIDEQVLKCLWKKERLLDSIKEEVSGLANADSKKLLRKIIYGGRVKEEMLGCPELEDLDAESLP